MRPIDADALDAAFTDLRFSADGTLAHWGDRPDWCLHGREVEKLIENAPTIGGWTSVKELLPEEHADEHPYEFEQFLCSTVWDDVRMVGFGTRTGDDMPHFWSGNSIWDDWVTHWMPLPKPAKEG